MIFKGSWKPFEVTSEKDKKVTKQSMYAEKIGDELDIDSTAQACQSKATGIKMAGRLIFMLTGIFIVQSTLTIILPSSNIQ